MKIPDKLQKRLITGFSLAPFVLLPVFIGQWLFLIFMLVIAVFSVYELTRLYARHYHQHPLHFYLLYPFTMGLLVLGYLHPQTFDNKATLSLAFTIVFIFILEMFAIKEVKLYFKKLFALRVLVYVGLCYPYLVLLRNGPLGYEKLLLLVFAVWGYDIFAYLVGVPFGRHKLFPTISPKKSLEGIIGGLFGAIVGLWIILAAFKDLGMLNVWQIIWIALISVTMAQMGDLFESYIKRLLAAKDSSHLIPGHGGILDRMDSFVLISPIFFFLMKIFLP